MSNIGPLGTNPAGAFERTCAGCGITFRTDHPRQRYCCNACKRKAQNRRAYERRTNPKAPGEAKIWTRSDR